MKILIATGLYAPDIGGPATYAAMLERTLPARGVELVVVPFHSVRGYPKLIRHVVYAWLIWRQTANVDLIYALDPVSVGLPAVLVAKVRRKKFLIRLGGDYAWEQGRGRFGMSETLDEYRARPTAAPRTVRLLARIQTWVTNQATIVIAPSQYLKSIIVSWGVSAARVQVIYSALSPLTPTETPQATKQQYNVTGPLIVTAARLVPWKGIVALVTVVKRLRESFPDVTLVIAGDGPERALLEQHIETSDVTDSVRLLGSVDKTKLANLKQAADLFVLNTAYEGLSHELLEVMALGTPIVTTPAGGNTELLSDQDTALLVPFNDEAAMQAAIKQIINDPIAAQARAIAARERTAQFAEDTVVRELHTLLVNVYES